jgi:hypothetical protein
MVLCDVWNDRNHRPFFFSNTVSTEWYSTILGYKVWWQHYILSVKPEWFMQGGAP